MFTVPSPAEDSNKTLLASLQRRSSLFSEPSKIERCTSNRRSSTAPVCYAGSVDATAGRLQARLKAEASFDRQRAMQNHARWRTRTSDMVGKARKRPLARVTRGGGVMEWVVRCPDLNVDGKQLVPRMLASIRNGCAGLSTGKEMMARPKEIERNSRTRTNHTVRTNSDD